MRVFSGLKVAQLPIGTKLQGDSGACVHSAACRCPHLRPARAKATPGSAGHGQACPGHWRSHTATNHPWPFLQGRSVGPTLHLSYSLTASVQWERGSDLEFLLDCFITRGLHHSFSLIAMAAISTDLGVCSRPNCTTNTHVRMYLQKY